MYSGAVIDTHVHLQLDEQMKMSSQLHDIDHYLRAQRRSTLGRSACLSWRRRGTSIARRQNDLVLELSQTGSGPWYAMCSVHPYDGDAALDELERVETAGARGVNLHPNTQDFDVADERVAAVVAKGR